MKNIQVSFNLTGKCNANCIYCADRDDPQSLDYKDLSPEDILKGYNKVRDMHPKATLDLTCMGKGEPLLNWDGVQTISNIKKRDQNTRLLAITNGTLAEKAEELAKQEWILAVSYDGIHNETERIGAKSSVVEKTIEKIMQLSPNKTIIKMTVTPHHYHI